MKNQQATFYAILAMALAAIVGMTGCTDSVLSDVDERVEPVHETKYRHAHLIDRASRGAGKESGWTGFVIGVQSTGRSCGPLPFVA